LIDTLIHYFSTVPNPLIYAGVHLFAYSFLQWNYTLCSEETVPEETGRIFGLRLMRLSISNFLTVCMRLFASGYGFSIFLKFFY